MVCSELRVGLAGVLMALGLSGCVTAPHDGLDATLWVQTSVEYAGLAEQAYDLAALRLDAALADPEWTACLEQTGEFQSLPPAVILDLDETVLDNSAYQAWLVAEDEVYSSDTWEAWCFAEEAGLVPGAKAFIDYAESKGVTVFYVTNRTASVEAPTRENLEALGIFTGGEWDRVLTKGEEDGWGSDKVARRTLIAQDFRVLLSIGDNLGDFTSEYKAGHESRRELFASHADKWGMSWIVLPNPSYGSWIDTLYDFDYGKSAEEKRALKRGHLHGWAAD